MTLLEAKFSQKPPKISPRIHALSLEYPVHQITNNIVVRAEWRSRLWYLTGTPIDTRHGEKMELGISDD